jgi:hypothetical protein
MSDIFEEKTVECVECGNKLKVIALENDDTDYLCNSCNYGDLDIDES